MCLDDLLGSRTIGAQGRQKGFALLARQKKAQQKRSAVL